MSFVNPRRFDGGARHIAYRHLPHSITGVSVHAPTAPEGTVASRIKADRTAASRCCKGSLEGTSHRKALPNVLRLSICCRPVIGHTPRKLPSKGRNLPLHRTSSSVIVPHFSEQCKEMQRMFCKFFVNASIGNTRKAIQRAEPTRQRGRVAKTVKE